jgi:hypothetical protein
MKNLEEVLNNIEFQKEIKYAVEGGVETDWGHDGDGDEYEYFREYATGEVLKDVINIFRKYLSE